jgi:hypothetical protein
MLSGFNLGFGGEVDLIGLELELSVELFGTDKVGRNCDHSVT